MNTSNNYKFERIEKKFWMSQSQYEQLLPILTTNLEMDSHGPSTICNIYYDTDDYSLIRKSIERPLFKEKLRIRSYGIPGKQDLVFIEIKRKLNGIGYKRRISTTFEKAKMLIDGQEINSDNPQIEKELLSFVYRYQPKPKVYLTYNRFALLGKDDANFRVTIDQHLYYRLSDPDKPSTDGMNQIMDDDSLVLMEIKFDKAIPNWLIKEMSRLKIYQAPFSKIGTCYIKHIA